MLGWTEFPNQELARDTAEARHAIALGRCDSLRKRWHAITGSAGGPIPRALA
jgi:hypothetical protein